MKQILTILILFGLTAFNSFGQTDEIPSKRQKQLDTLIYLIKNDRVLELASRVDFPITRPNPIPDIKDKQDFTLYYPILFDSTLKVKLITTNFDKSNTIDKYTGFGLLNGEIWIDDYGKIMTINYSSKKEKELKSQLHNETENIINSSIGDWKENILVCETDKFLIRIDLLENNQLRYISWSKPKSIKDKPDLILFQGVQEFQGSMGGVTYTFTNGGWTYQIDRVEMAESHDRLGLYLRIYQNDKEKISYKTTEIK